ncbi:tetratricopeptide repeat protein [Streptomyces sp. NBC_01465]|uniref:tetratricopeptide repeat protein n=1 Tax=Streptomyces sp. NBC_01465 TaxID=2903878 RepID=UPI002E31F6B1|nr:tetratricopeptide repeat protein [Streptomyces sp. NBC_01465]
MRLRNRRSALAAAAALAAAVGGLLALGPDTTSGPGPVAAPRAEGGALAAAGAPAPAGELAATVETRRGWLRKHPDDAASWAVLGSARIGQARRSMDPAYYPKAEAALRRSLSVAPRNPDAMTGMGALANARHDFGAAKGWGERVRAAAPDRWSVYPVLVDAYTQLGDYRAASRAVQRLLDLRPGLPAFTRAAYELEIHGRTAESALALREALAAANSPAERAFCLQRLGELAWQRGDVRGALRLQDDALRTDPEHHAALVGRARAEAALGRTGAALRDYRTAVERVPLPEYVLELGELYESLGRVEEARAQYAVLRAEVKLFAANGARDDLTLGLYEADHGSAAAAVRDLEREWGRRKSVLVADGLGWALHRAGRDEEALAYARKAAAIGTRSAVFAYHRGEIERALGMRDAARTHLGEALRLNPHFSPLLAPRARKAMAS